MRAFPPAEQLNFLLGNELTKISVQPHHIELAFAEGPMIVIEHGLEHIDADGRKHSHDPQQKCGPDPIVFHALIDQTIERMDVTDYRLTLFFSGGSALNVLSVSGPYESGHIWDNRYDEAGYLKSHGLIIF